MPPRKAPPDPADELSQETIDQLRMQMTLKVIAMVNRRQWPSCPRGHCRRRRVCTPAGFECANPVPRRPLTPEQDAQVRAELYRTFQRAAQEPGRAG